MRDFERGTPIWRNGVRRFESSIAPIYPFPLKNGKKAASWMEWPDDVVQLLKLWNGSKRSHSLSFYYHGYAYKCAECMEFFDGNYTVAFLDQQWICDDCLIKRARCALATGDIK